MTDPSRLPVLVGIAQNQQRITDPKVAREPLDLMLEAVKAAAADAGSAELLTKADSVRVIKGVWGYHNPAAVLAVGVGCPSAETCMTPYGGNAVQQVVNASCLDIQNGEKDIILITGAECGNTQAKARKAGFRPEWQEAPGTPDRVIGKDSDMSSPEEVARGIRMPIQFYPLFENAWRHANGWSIPEHLERISSLWAKFSDVAADNPHAWLRDRVDAETIRTPSASNRPVSFPYPKLMNSNNSVDMGAALILCSQGTAERLGIPKSQWIYPQAGTDASDHYFVSNRQSLAESPAMRLAGRKVLELAGVAADDLSLMDVYSCFPVAVQIAAHEIGLPTDRDLTVTGGLTFHGGPLNNYVMHSVARTAELLRAGKGKTGLVTANGGYLTKHSFGVYSTERPAAGFQYANLQAQVDAEPKRAAAPLDYSGPATVESYTVMYGANGPAAAHVAALLPDGSRAWANSQDAAMMDAMTKQEFCGKAVQLEAGNAIFS